MPFLHVLAVVTIVVAALLLAARGALALIGRSGRVTDLDRHWFGFNGAAHEPYLWFGELVIGRDPSGDDPEWYCDRFSGPHGQARGVGFAVCGIDVHLDLLDTTARRLAAAPWLYPITMLTWSLLSTPEFRTDPGAWVATAFLIGMCAAFAFVVYALDVVYTALHYARLGAQGDQHEAYERGRREGQRFEVERVKWAEGMRHDAPPFPANPYAA